MEEGKKPDTPSGQAVAEELRELTGAFLALGRSREEIDRMTGEKKP